MANRSLLNRSRCLLQEGQLLRRCSSYHENRGQGQPLEERLKEMGNRSFWDNFYQQRTSEHGHFDWFMKYESIQSHLADVISKMGARSNSRAHNVMDIGCGTSSLAHHIAKEYNNWNVFCVDFSKVALDQLKESQVDNSCIHQNNFSNVEYLVADGFSVPFRDSMFDLVFEKGTVDSLLKTPALSPKAPYFIVEVVRLLNEDGIYCQFSDEDPELRLPLLEKAKHMLVNMGQQEVSVGFKEISPNSSLQYFLYHLYVRK